MPSVEPLETSGTMHVDEGCEIGQITSAVSNAEIPTNWEEANVMIDSYYNDRDLQHGNVKLENVHDLNVKIANLCTKFDVVNTFVDQSDRRSKESVAEFKKCDHYKSILSEKIRHDRIAAFSGDGEFSSLLEKSRDLVAAAQAMGDCEGNKADVKVRKVRRGHESCTTGTFGEKDKYFIKIYKEKQSGFESEACFFDLLDEREKRFGETIGSGCIVRPVLMLCSTSIAMTIFPLCQLGDAFDLFDREEPLFSCDVYVSFYNDLAMALFHLFLCGLKHNDVKLENIMYQLIDGTHRFALTDHEYAATLGKNVKGGTANYSSPPRLRIPQENDEKADGWSFAITIINAWEQRLFQQSTVDSCCACNGFITLSNRKKICFCSCYAKENQPLLDEDIRDIVHVTFERFAYEKGERLDDTFPQCGGAENAMRLVQNTLIGLLNLSGDRLGPDSLRMLI